MSTAIPAVVVGATGYVGGELLRLIAGHPAIALHAAVSSSRAGSPIAGLFPALTNAYPDLAFCELGQALDGLAGGDRVAIFSAAPHGASATVVARLLEQARVLSLDTHVVDVSADFRYANGGDFESVYGTPHTAPELLDDFTCALPEHLEGAPTRHVGHPGCFATAMLLAAVPLYAGGFSDMPLFVTGITGSTGSGRSPSAGTHHPERHSNLFAYKPLAHRHVPEVQSLIETATGQRPDVRFIPHSGPFARGIYVTAQVTLSGEVSARELAEYYEDFYAASPFVQITDGAPRLKDVQASNFARLGMASSGESAVVMCAIDNLVKGAAGGAVQWMNRLWSLPEESGLLAVSPAWT